MQTLLTAIVTWLSMHAGLPAIYDHPRVEFASPAKIAALRAGGVASGRTPSAAEHRHGDADHAQTVEAIYDDKSRTIFLREGWTGETSTEVSVLVHEMVHHLQNVGGLKYECPQAREKPAYAAQDQWLAQSGRNLMHEFELDPVTLLVLTKCMG